MTTSPVLPQVALVRAAIGLLQGGALYLLYRAGVDKSWPATDGEVFAPLLLVAIFVPLIIIAGIDNLRAVPLAIWTIAAATICAGLAVYDLHSEPTNLRFGMSSDGGPRILPAFTLWLALTAALFMVHTLVVSAAADGRFTATYTRHFDVAWKHTLQIALAVAFVGIFWALLWLGAALFQLIQLKFLYDLLQKSWFAIPVTTLSIACALHVTDASAGLVRGTRTLVLTLLSWLLPMMTAIAVAFLVALPFTGLEPLWNTHRATVILLVSAAALVVLINAAYQDGLPEPTVTPIMRYSRMVAAVALVPLMALAAYGLYLRVQQYGWTPQRVWSAACIAVLACYAVGYALAVVLSGSALRGLPTTNVTTSYVMLAALLALFTPIADPARLSVSDQISRLNSGQTRADKFDYKFLRFDSGIYGRATLAELAKRNEGPQAAEIAKRAAEAVVFTGRYQTAAVAPPTPEARAANVSVFPASQTLPDSFFQQDWKALYPKVIMPFCLTSNSKCEAFLVDLDGDGTAEILLLSEGGGLSMAFKAGTDGSWTPIGSISNSHCPGVREALRDGKFHAVQPPFSDIEAGGERLRISAVNCGWPR